jgi:hypothetical protein
MLKLDEHKGLRGSGRQSVIPKAHGRCCIVVCVVLFKVELNFFTPVVRPTFYSSRSDSYTMTKGSTGGPRVVESLYSRTLPARSSK